MYKSTVPEMAKYLYCPSDAVMTPRTKDALQDDTASNSGLSLKD